jgi:hypothetical protein
MKTDEELIEGFKETYVHGRLFTESQVHMLMGWARAEIKREILSEIPNMGLLQADFSEQFKRLAECPDETTPLMKKRAFAWFITGAAAVIKKLK